MTRRLCALVLCLAGLTACGGDTDAIVSDCKAMCANAVSCGYPRPSTCASDCPVQVKTDIDAGCDKESAAYYACLAALTCDTIRQTSLCDAQRTALADCTCKHDSSLCL